MKTFQDILIENPIIAAIRNQQDLEQVLESDSKVVFILYGTILNIGTIAGQLRTAGKLFFVHLDMIEGLRNDESGLPYIKKVAEPFGIITTKQNQVKGAKRLGLAAILRLFIIDSKSLATGFKYVEELRPDAVEVMPGVSTKIIKACVGSMKATVIAGGLIDTKEEVIQSLKAGALAISSTKKEIWEM